MLGQRLVEYSKVLMRGLRSLSTLFDIFKNVKEIVMSIANLLGISVGVDFGVVFTVVSLGARKRSATHVHRGLRLFH